MSYDLVCGLLVAIGILILLLSGLVLLARFVDSARAHPSSLCEVGAAPGAANSHRLSVSIAEALVQSRIVDPGKMNDVAQIVALKIELQNAISGSPTGG